MPQRRLTRAVADAIGHLSLGFFRMVGKTSKDRFVDVAVAKELPYGTVTVNAVKGERAGRGNTTIIANAVVVSLDDGAPG